MTNRQTSKDIVAARLYGISFILAFLSYGFGNAMIESQMASMGTSTEASLSYRLAIISMTLLHTLANVGVLTIMYGILRRYSRFLITGYFALGVIATAALLVGGGLLALIPQANASNIGGAEGSAQFVDLLHKGNFVLYQAGMTVWGVGGILMCIVLWRTKLVPLWLPTWGFAGYAIFIVGTVSEFFDSGIGVSMSLPGGLFEIALSVYLILKGFDYSQSDNAAI